MAYDSKEFYAIFNLYQKVNDKVLSLLYADYQFIVSNKNEAFNTYYFKAQYVTN